MHGVSVSKINETTFEVRVLGGNPTTHTVTVSPAYAAKLAIAGESTEQLVRRSFDFLLEREPNTSILRSFELPVIARYFPEYERVIRGML